MSGKTTTFTVTPNSGYQIADVTGCNGALSGNTYTTAAITSDCTVTATFALIPPPVFTVAATANANSKISPQTQTVVSGKTTTFTVTPNTGYQIDTMAGTCGGTLFGTKYTTSAMTADCTVTATFALIPPPVFTVTATAGANGKISPQTQTVVNGQTTTFTVTPNTGYQIDKMAGTCGGTLSGTKYTTAAITVDCTVTASFKAIAEPTYTLTLKTPDAQNGWYGFRNC